MTQALVQTTVPLSRLVPMNHYRKELVNSKLHHEQSTFNAIATYNFRDPIQVDLALLPDNKLDLSISDILSDRRLKLP